MNTYLKWQAKQYNYAMFANAQIAFVLSAMPVVHSYWIWKLGPKPVTWLRMIAVGRRFHGQGLGRRGLFEAIEFFTQKGYRELYLEYVADNGFLADFYGSCGFEEIAGEQHAYLTGLFNMILARKVL